MIQQTQQYWIIALCLWMISGYNTKLYAQEIEATTEEITEYPTGLIMDDKAYNALPRQPLFRGTKFGELPLQVSLKDYCPKVGDQGEMQSCVGWAVGYAALTIQHAIENKLTDAEQITKNSQSALFIYNQIKPRDCNYGARIEDAIHFLEENGNCLFQEFDAAVDDCDTIPPENLRSKAKQNTITDYMTLFGQDEDPKVKVFKTKQSLAEKKPVIIGLKTRKSFHGLRKGSKYWWAEKGNTISAGGHALVVIGYDEAKQAFELFNSWGEDWGNDGFIWIKYKDYSRFCKYAYQIHLNKRAKKTKTEVAKVEKEEIEEVKNEIAKIEDIENEEVEMQALAGHFNFNYLSTFEGGQAKFKQAKATLSENKQCYTLDKKDWELGQLFQLVAMNDIKDVYVYAFSLDSKNEVNIHWPRQENLNEKFANTNETPLIPMQGAEIVIPGRESGLSITNVGTDYLCVLFSNQRLDDLPTLLQQIQSSEGETVQRMYTTFGERLVPIEDVQYHPNAIQFSSKTKSDKYIVPLILKVESK